MWRRRWRHATIVAFLIFMTKEIQCQGDNDFYYTPERSFAQVQPPIFPNNRPSNYFDNGENYRIGQTVQPPPYNEGRVRFPTPNYDQNPSPFQLPTGRSQSSSQYYINQPDVSTSQRLRFRPALPYNFQLVHPHPASTKKPDLSQIHSVAYQNDPSKPETFLGQITINNPDVDYLQNSRFKNIPFDGNSLKSNGQSGHIAHDDEIDNDDHEFFDNHKVTTYNPTKIGERQKINIKPNSARFSHFETLPAIDVKNQQNKPINRNVGNNNLKSVKSIPHLYQGSSTEYKSLLDLEPLLEDDISDISSFRELMKNNQGSFDVQVIKSNTSHDSDDSKPDASSMNSKNMPNNRALKTMSADSTTTQSHNFVNQNITVTKIDGHNTNDDDINDEEEVGEEYVEYYEDAEDPAVRHTTTKTPSTANLEPVTDIYDEYDSSDEPEKSIEESRVNTTNSFDVLVMKPNKTMVKDDNFQQFVDTTLIDQTDLDSDNDTALPSLKFTFSNEDVSSIETPSILGQEVVSVVTTKSVVNGTISIPEVTYPPTARTNTVSPAIISENNDSSPVTTESWIVVASVQTSRSVSGARFLPFPTVEQDEKKQVLADEDEEIVTDNPKQHFSSTTSGSSSTENINDKLDSIQSELSSAVLSGNLSNENKNIELITETTLEPKSSTTSSRTPSVINVFTLKSTQYSVVTERSYPEPLPVQIKKFAPRLTTSTTPKPKKKLVTIMDDLSGLLPAGYKSRQSYKNKRTSTTSTTTSTTTTIHPITSALPTSSTENVIINGTQGRSSGISSKNKVIILDDKSLLPKEYKPRERTPDILFKQNQDDINKFLPSGYKPEQNNYSNINKTINLDTLKNVKEVDLSSFLPKGFQLNATSFTTTTEKNKISLKIPVHTSDVSAFLPPGYKMNSSESENDENLLNKFKIVDVGNFLPADFKPNSQDENKTSTTASPGGFKLVFPSRPGGKTTRKTTTQKSSIGPPLITPKIQKGWPTRATTEFTGWPSPSTTPFSLEKLLELQRNATSTTSMIEVSTESTTRRILTTTTTTPAPPQPTTPGVCRHDCDIAGTIKIVSGVKWIPELLDQHTREWQQLAKEVKQELNSVYSKSDILNKWYKGIRIDGFSQGSVLVDYFIELNNVEERVDTYRLKKLFHKSLNVAKTASVMEEEIDDTFDPDVMVGDQPDEERMRKSDEKMTKTIDKSAGKLEMGKFIMDPAYTEFIVLPKREEPTFVQPDEESLLPQWGIAVIVIALASLLFVVIFGVTVLVNRQKSTKTKQPIPLSEDMLRELDKSHMGGFDDNIHQLKERDMPYLPSGKRMSSAFIEQLAYPNPGDSWRSEWTPQLQKYMQHYAPDSGRGSQIYGTTGNGYGGGGSQLYGQTGAGAGSQGYGYTGEFPRSHYSRRRSEYDSNF